MRELGQFLAGPGSMFNCPSPWLAVGLLALCVTLSLSAVLLLRPLAWDVSARRVMAFIPLVALVSLLAVLLSQWAAEWIYHEGVRIARYALYVGGVGMKALWILAYLVGWGYSRSLQPAAFEEHLLSFTLGVGLLEELVKGCAGLFFAGVLFGEHGRWERSARQLALAFMAAGLSFGAGEAIFYFQAYSGMNSEPSFYLLRAVWCVLLHGSWSFLTAMLLYALRFDPDGGTDSETDSVAKFVGGCLPAALLHGFYDACCMHSVAALWVVGGLCLGIVLLGLVLLRESPKSGTLLIGNRGRNRGHC